LGAEAKPIACVIWDLSKGGVRLTAAHADALPDVFTLILGSDGQTRRHCRVVWKKKPYIGVKFVSASEAEHFQQANARPQPKNAGHWLNPAASKYRPQPHHKSMRARRLFEF
jgi:hypothetical protein